MSNLLFGNLKSNLAICTLWTQTEVIQKIFDKNQYCFIGNLYSANGLSSLIRTLYKYPQARYLLICGADLSDSSDKLLKLWEKGVDAENYIVDDEIHIEPEIPKKDIDLLRKSVKLINMKNVLNKEKLLNSVSDLKKLPPFSKSKSFPVPKPVVPATFPSEFSGFLVKASKVAEAWPKIMKEIMLFGREKKSRYGKVKEILNCMAVVEDEEPDKPFLPDFLKISRDELERYYLQITTARKIKGISYTYGQRLRKAEDEVKGIGDQISYMIKELKKDSHSRRAMATTWEIVKDQRSSAPPCLILVQCMIVHKKLYMTAFLRSNDMFAAWPRNAFGLRKLQKMIAENVNVRMGSLTTISKSAHIYERDWKDAEIISHKKVALEWKGDPRGYFIIKIDGKKLKILHYANQGTFLREYEGNTAEELYKMLLDNNAISMPEHWVYIGKELMKAEMALRLGKKYVQDSDLDLN